mmetsp:Transcript_68820/g.109189  ORF Transcript_68820/g.109189 Transcript_68820/m.109189 type:complete len:262 (+) Transcript_68820:44-829(+)
MMVNDTGLTLPIRSAAELSEEAKRRKDSNEGDLLLAAIAEEAEKLKEEEKPRELWTAAALRQENEQLKAEIKRLKAEAAAAAEYQMSSPWYPSWSYPADMSPMSDYMSMTPSNNAFGTASMVGPTSMMMRNIPNNYTRAKVLELLEKEGFGGTFDFFYLPIDLKKKNGLGYAFINFIDHGIAAAFRQTFDGFSNWIATSGKVCQVTFSDRIQGLEAHVERYRNSAIMHPSVPDEFKPMIFQNGHPVPFPCPTKSIPTPQER